MDNEVAAFLCSHPRLRLILHVGAYSGAAFAFGSSFSPTVRQVRAWCVLPVVAAACAIYEGALGNLILGYGVWWALFSMVSLGSLLLFWRDNEGSIESTVE